MFEERTRSLPVLCVFFLFGFSERGARGSDTEHLMTILASIPLRLCEAEADNGISD